MVTDGWDESPGWVKGIEHFHKRKSVRKKRESRQLATGPKGLWLNFIIDKAA